jgi:hypothetical protein
MFVFFGENAVTQYNLHECAAVKSMRVINCIISSFNYTHFFVCTLFCNVDVYF